MINRHIPPCLQALRELSAVDLPVRAAFAVGLNLHAVETYAKTLDEVHAKLVRECAVLGDDGMPKQALNEKGEPMHGRVSLRDDKLAHYTAGLKALEEIEVSGVHVHKLKLTDFGDVKLKAGAIAALAEMVEV